MHFLKNENQILINSQKDPKINLKVWLLAIRPRTLTASVGPVLIGLTLSHFVNGVIAIIILLCTLLMQIGANLVNDYYDHFSGVDSEKRIGPVRMTSSGLISIKQM